MCIISFHTVGVLVVKVSFTGIDDLRLQPHERVAVRACVQWLGGGSGSEWFRRRSPDGIP